jgi:GNAT superfamily N-acetyltransferase
MSDLTISPVTNESELKDFASFPWKIYREDPNWVPPIFSEHLKFLSPDHNPYFEHAKAEYFLAKRGDEIVGTIMVTTNDHFNEFQELNYGFFGFFEVLEDPEAAAELLRTAKEWAREAGHEKLMGPAQFSTNDEVGLLIDGFDDPPRLLMTYNPQRYATYLEDAGFTKAMDLHAYAVKVEDVWKNFPEKVLRVSKKIQKRRNLVIRSINMKNFYAEVEKLKKIYNASWERNWGFVPFTDREIDNLAEQLKPFIDPDLAIFVEREGEPIGFGIGLPDLNQPLLKAYPTPKSWEPFTLVKLLWNWKVRRSVDWIRVWALGVLPEYRGLGIDSLMYLELAEQARRKGFEWAEMSWILEINDMISRGIKLMGGEVYKTYRVYESEPA